ncbi:hypothetical protein [Streptomyces sp. NBC_00448]|uniref:hypothetical protein n=1 Tax=Streptomyces sp. NBC_00448 TaxID=2903652 RepID=UPI002E1AC706
MVKRVDADRSALIVSTQEHASGTVIMTGTQSWGSAGGGMDLTVPPAKIGLAKLNHAARAEVRLVGGAEYVRVDPASSGPFKGKSWLRYAGATALGGDAADTLDRTGTQSPVDFLRTPAASDGVTRVGRETMLGKQTTHYRGTFTTDPTLRKRGVPATAGFDLYVGDDGLPVMLVRNFEGEFTTTEFQSFGGVHAVAVPPAAQTADTSASFGPTHPDSA